MNEFKNQSKRGANHEEFWLQSGLQWWLKYTVNKLKISKLYLLICTFYALGFVVSVVQQINYAIRS